MVESKYWSLIKIWFPNNIYPLTPIIIRKHKYNLTDNFLEFHTKIEWKIIFDFQLRNQVLIFEIFQISDNISISLQNQRLFQLVNKLIVLTFHWQDTGKTLDPSEMFEEQTLFLAQIHHMVRLWKVILGMYSGIKHNCTYFAYWKFRKRVLNWCFRVGG